MHFTVQDQNPIEPAWHPKTFFRICKEFNLSNNFNFDYFNSKAATKFANHQRIYRKYRTVLFKYKRP
jgi:hypothetical protein